MDMDATTQTSRRQAMNGQNLGNVVAEATMAAAAEILRQRGRKLDDTELDSLIKVLRAEAKAALSRILDDGKVLLDSGRSLWLETLLRTECVAAAKAAVDAVA